MAGQEDALQLDTIPEEGSDEIGMLSKGYNALVRRLRDFHESLDTMVQARTAELRGAARLLRTPGLNPPSHFLCEPRPGR